MSFRVWSRVVIASLGICIGGPALVYYVSPTEEELFLKYNPELQKRSIANRRQNQEDFDAFVQKLKEYSKSDRPIWEEAAADEARTRAATERRLQAEQRRQPPQSSAPSVLQPRPQRPLAAQDPPRDPDAIRKQLREESLRSK